MEYIISLLVFAVSLGYGIKFRYKVAQWLNLRITRARDDETEIIDLKRDIEDAERRIKFLESQERG